MRWSAERAIAAGFSVALVILIAVASSPIAIPFKSRKRLLLSNIHAKYWTIFANFRSALIDIETAGRGYALTGDRLFLNPYRAAVPRAQNVMRKLESEVRNPEIRRVKSRTLRVGGREDSGNPGANPGPR